MHDIKVNFTYSRGMHDIKVNFTYSRGVLDKSCFKAFVCLHLSESLSKILY